MELSSYCVACRHFNWAVLDVDTDNNSIKCIRCKAYANVNIPDEILSKQVDHRQPFANDNGITFEAADGVTVEDIKLIFATP